MNLCLKGILNEFNTDFQSAISLLHKLKPEVEKIFKDLCSNYMEIAYIRNTHPLQFQHSNPKYFLKLEDIYLGIQAQESFNELKKDPNVKKPDAEAFLKSRLHFYIEVISQIKSRFDFSDDLFSILNILEPKTAQAFSIKSLSAVFKRFPMLNEISKLDVQVTNSEWNKNIHY